MKKSNCIIFLFLTFTTLLLFSTKELPTKGDMIRAEVERKLSIYRNKEIEKCTAKVMKQAGDLVDSTLIARARLQVKEAVAKPEIPFRPDRPEVKLPKDTMPVQPIFSKEELELLKKAEQETSTAPK